jgi:hypothetical protein
MTISDNVGYGILFFLAVANGQLWYISTMLERFGKKYLQPPF